MDFVHEDLSLMSQEMDRWRALHKVKVGSIKQEKNTILDHAKTCMFLSLPLSFSALHQRSMKYLFSPVNVSQSEIIVEKVWNLPNVT